MFFYKGPDSKYLGIMGHAAPVATTPLSYYSVKAARDNA